MAKQNKYQKVSSQTQDDAMKVARATQRPGQTKEQTKLIALGIEKGISQYKKQQKEKSRELNKKLQKVTKSIAASADGSVVENKINTIVYKQSLLPWLLLVASWLSFATYYFLSA